MKKRILTATLVLIASISFLSHLYGKKTTNKKGINHFISYSRTTFTGNFHISFDRNGESKIKKVRLILKKIAPINPQERKIEITDYYRNFAVEGLKP